MSVNASSNLVTDQPIKKQRQEPNGKTSEMLILYGSNTGTCQTLAQRLAADAGLHGYHGSILDMDSGIHEIQQKTLAIIITASYEGEPPDNASHFVHWMSRQDVRLGLLEYGVFGCGHSDWAATFQKIPKGVDEKLDRAGAKRLAPCGFADAAKGDLYGDFDSWTDSYLWPALKTGGSLNAGAG